jgi:hypothetical protein
MSVPGHIALAELVRIGPDMHGDTGRLREVPGAWFRKTDLELRAHFGIGIDFRNTGTYRTRQMTLAIPGALPGGDHEKGRALDIRNWKQFVERDAIAFYRILASNGWRNITSDGKPFRSEPWHWVCIKTELPTQAVNRRRGKSMATLYYCTKSDKPSTSASPQDVEEWALGGDSPGTSANWLPTKSQSVANGFAAGHGPAVFLTRASFARFRASYLEPLKIAGATGQAAAAKVPSADDIVDKFAERIRE